MSYKSSLLLAFVCSLGWMTSLSYGWTNVQSRHPVASKHTRQLDNKRPVLKMSQDENNSQDNNNNRLQVVWMGAGDFRTDDHLGLHQALSKGSSGNIMPMVVLEGLHHLPGAVAHLHDTAALVVEALKDLQSNLYANHQLELEIYNTIQEAQEALEAHAAESGVDVHVCDLGPIDNKLGYGAYAQLDKLLGDCTTTNVQVHPWTCRLRQEPWEQLQVENHDFPLLHTDYVEQHTSALKPLEPLEMPQLDRSVKQSNSLDKTIKKEIPSADALSLHWKELLQSQAPEIHETSVNTGLYGTHWGGLEAASVGESRVLETLAAYCHECDEDDEAFHSHDLLPRARSNRRSLEHSANQWMLDHSHDNDDKDASSTPKTQNWIAGEAMTRYLSAPLLLGTVSPRRLWHMGKEQNSILHTSVLRTLVETSEWHKLLAAAQSEVQEESNVHYEYWRWHGFLCRYGRLKLQDSTENIAAPQNREGVLLVHGFGASGSQWTKTMEELKAKVDSNEAIATSVMECLAPDLIGFGQSEKPPLSYTQYLWESYISAFVKEVALHRHDIDHFVIGGNSIGGYTALGKAADDTIVAPKNKEDPKSFVSCSGAPGTLKCTGVVLLNSAGQLQTREEIAQMRQTSDKLKTMATLTSMGDLPACSPIARPVARFFGNGLLWYLRPRIQSICKNLYPTNPSAVDEMLCGGILRDSLDPGAINVMISGSKLPPPRTANELLGAEYGSALNEGSKDIHEGMWTGPVLVAQGILDPLNDAKSRASMFGDLRDDIEVVPIDAGHCPHDEVPDAVASALFTWMETTKDRRLQSAI